MPRAEKTTDQWSVIVETATLGEVEIAEDCRTLSNLFSGNWVSRHCGQRAMLMAMEPIWECDFHPLSYGFRPERSAHHAIRTVKLQLTDCGEARGRWVASYRRYCRISC